MQISENPYLTVLERNLPRVLSLVSRDSLGASLGIADRRYWAWKTVDFPNASMQSLTGGFARLSKRQNLGESFASVEFSKIALDLIYAIGPMTSRSGGLAEAFPGEDSFCVTGQVLSEAMDAIAVLGTDLSPEDKQRLMGVLSPLAGFLMRNEETHGIISNHLATSALAMVRWGLATGDGRAVSRAASFLEVITRHASSEGWFLEYSGADPGYQTWAMASLAQIFDEAPGLIDTEFLGSSMRFLAPFALPDGGFANGAGARLTSFLMAVGPELMAGAYPEATFLASFARKHIAHHRFVALDTVDEPNIAPFFNDLVRSAEFFDQTPSLRPVFRQATENDFPEGGLFVRHHESRSVVVSSARGGWVCIAEDGQPTQIKPEPVFRDLRGRLFIARMAMAVEVHAGSLLVKSQIRRFKSHSQSPMKLLLLRLFVLSLGRWKGPREFVKRLLARYLLTRKHKSVGEFERLVDTRTGETTDRLYSSRTLSGAGVSGAPHHMASYGYWRY